MSCSCVVWRWLDFCSIRPLQDPVTWYGINYMLGRSYTVGLPKQKNFSLRPNNRPIREFCIENVLNSKNAIFTHITQRTHSRGWDREFSTVMQARDEVEDLHNCLEFSQPLSCLYQAMQPRKAFLLLKSQIDASRESAESSSCDRLIFRCDNSKPKTVIDNLSLA